MAFCKLAQVAGQRGRRGFYHITREKEEWNRLLAMLEKHVPEPGKAFLPALKIVVSSQLQAIGREAEALRREADSHKGKAEAFHVALSALHVALRRTEELLAKARLEALGLKGLNNARGLFEMLQEYLSEGADHMKGLRGVNLWKAILNQRGHLRLCVSKHAMVGSSDVPRLAMIVYHIYTVMSDHVLAGKELAQLQAHQEGKIEFKTGPLSPQQVGIFKSLGKEAGIDIIDN